MYSGSSDGEGHEPGGPARKIPPASSMLWVRNLRRYIGSGAGLGSEALMGWYSFPYLIILRIVLFKYFCWSENEILDLYT